LAHTVAYTYECEVFRADDLRVAWGINEGDALARPEACCAGDRYRLRPDAAPLMLHLNMGEQITVASAPLDGLQGCALGVHGALRLMSVDGDTLSGLVLQAGAEVMFLPLSPMRPQTDYALIEIDTDAAALRMAEMVQGCFGPGTRITMADGSLRPVEALAPGDSVRTRDHGPQPLRWIGKLTKRAHGPFAPVTFPPGLLGNLGPLTLGPLQRIFLYQRGEDRLGERAEVLVQSQYLVDGAGVLQREGGFATHYSLAFDDHQIIYAEGIPVESLLVSRATVARLPDSLAQDLSARFPHLNQRAHFAQDLSADLVTTGLRDTLLRSQAK
jgi:hypothetical protein